MDLNRRQFLAAAPLAALAPALGRQGGTEPSRPGAAPDWASLRRDLTVDSDLAYFNWGTYGPPSRDVAAVEIADRETMRRNYNVHFGSHFPAAAIKPVVTPVARFVGADLDEFAFATGATEAMNFIAAGLDLKPGDEILTTEHEHQAGIYPYLLQAKRRGITVRQVPMPAEVSDPQQLIDLFAMAIWPRTRVLSFCHVQYTDGLKLPAKELCDLARRRKVISVVDGAQAVGMGDVNIRDIGCDFYAASLHKWLGAPYGTGFLTVRQDQLDAFWPTVVEGYDGWDATDRYGKPATGPAIDFGADWPKALLKLSVNFRYDASAFWAVPAAIERHERIGRTAIEARIRVLVGRFRQGLAAIPGVEIVTPASPDLSGGLVSFRKADVDTRAVSFALSRQDRVVVRYVKHAPINLDVLRASIHAFNTEDEIDRLVAALATRLRT